MKIYERIIEEAENIYEFPYMIYEIMLSTIEFLQICEKKLKSPEKVGLFFFF